LDYLNDGDESTTTDLGVTGLWLRPINPSSAPHGYAVTDYYDVNPEYGTMADFEELLTQAHTRGIHVIVDLVLNHASNQHLWFIAAEDPASKYYDWFIWSDIDPGYTGSWGQQVWFPAYGRYFYSTFSPGQPDLNYNNPEVTAEMYKIVSFWLGDVGVDGFRLDAAKHIIEEGTSQANTTSTHQWYKDFRPFYKNINPQAMIVGEIWEPADVQKAYLQGDELDMAFDFYLAFAMADAVNAEEADIATENLRFAYTEQPSLHVGPFLSNFDIDRLMTQFGDNPDKVKVAYSLMLTLPGTPFIYYGEEIGMQGTAYDYVRRPMQWTGSVNAGFTVGTPWLALGDGWESYNVEVETGDPQSILAHVRELIHLREGSTALRNGDLSILATGNEKVYAIFRVNREEAILVLVNLGESSTSDYRLTLDASQLGKGEFIPSTLMGVGSPGNLVTDAAGGFSGYLPTAELTPYQTLIIQFHR
jgi:glycosidase